MDKTEIFWIFYKLNKAVQQWLCVSLISKKWRHAVPDMKLTKPRVPDTKLTKPQVPDTRLVAKPKWRMMIRHRYRTSTPLPTVSPQALPHQDGVELFSPLILPGTSFKCNHCSNNLSQVDFFTKDSWHQSTSHYVTHYTLYYSIYYNLSHLSFLSYTLNTRVLQYMQQSAP